MILLRELSTGGVLAGKYYCLNKAHLMHTLSYIYNIDANATDVPPENLKMDTHLRVFQSQLWYICNCY